MRATQIRRDYQAHVALDTKINQLYDLQARLRARAAKRCGFAPGDVLRIRDNLGRLNYWRVTMVDAYRSDAAREIVPKVYAERITKNGQRRAHPRALTNIECANAEIVERKASR